MSFTEAENVPYFTVSYHYNHVHSSIFSNFLSTFFMQSISNLDQPNLILSCSKNSDAKLITRTFLMLQH